MCRLPVFISIPQPPSTQDDALNLLRTKLFFDVHCHTFPNDVTYTLAVGYTCYLNKLVPQVALNGNYTSQNYEKKIS